MCINSAVGISNLAASWLFGSISFFGRRYGRVRNVADILLLGQNLLRLKSDVVYIWQTRNLHRFTMEMNQAKTARYLSHGHWYLNSNNNITSFLKFQDLWIMTPCRQVSTFRKLPYSETIQSRNMLFTNGHTLIFQKYWILMKAAIIGVTWWVQVGQLTLQYFFYLRIFLATELKGGK